MRGGRHSHRSRLGLALVWSAVVFCPCHWPLLLIGLLGGTALGAATRVALVPMFAGAAIYFALAVGLGYWLIRRARGAANKCLECARGSHSSNRFLPEEADRVQRATWG